MAILRIIKKYTTLFFTIPLVLGVLIVMMLLSNDEVGESHFMLLEGSLMDLKGETIYLVRSRQVQSYRAYYKADDSTKVDSSGKFKFHLKVSSADFYKLIKQDGLNVFYDKQFFLGPKDTLIVNKINDNDEVELRGNAASVNNFQWVFHEKFIKGRNLQKQIEKESEEFISYLNTRKEQQLKFTENYANNEAFLQPYKQYLIWDITYQWANDYFYYLRHHNDDWKYILPDSLPYDFLKEIDLENTTFSFNLNYHETIDGILEAAYQESTVKLDDSIRWETKLQDKFKIIENTFTGVNQEIALKNLSNEFGFFLMTNNEVFYSTLKKIKDHFYEIKSSDLYYDLFLKDYNAYLRIAPGSAAPNFTLPDLNDTQVSLIDFKGKVVYIDFWGTWCVPCIAAIPNIIELQRKFKNEKNIIFLNVALEYGKKEINRWRSFLKEKEYPGVHVIAEKGFLNEELKPYKLSFAPTYVLINPLGEIVDPRAGSPDKIQKKIEELLNELSLTTN